MSNTRGLLSAQRAFSLLPIRWSHAVTWPLDQTNMRPCGGRSWIVPSMVPIRQLAIGEARWPVRTEKRINKDQVPMKTRSVASVWVVMWTLVCGAAMAAQADGSAWDWVTGSPESQGMSGQKLQAMREVLAAHRTEMLLVIRNDTIVCEWYTSGFGPTNLHGIASMSKAVVGGVSVAVALTNGRLALDDQAARFIPRWQGSRHKSRITLRQLGSHTSGLADAEASGLPHEQLTGWEGDFWKRLPPPHDPFTLARDVTPIKTNQARNPATATRVSRCWPTPSPRP